MKRLGQLEAEVMDLLWSRTRPVSVRDVLEDLRSDRPIAYTTVMTVLDNLHRKDFVTRHKDGRAYLYEPAQSREQHTAELMETVLSGSRNPGATLLQFVGQMPAEEIALLRAALEDVEREEGGEHK